MADVVRLGTEGAYPPWNFLNDDGEVDGFERELGDEVCARAELECEWVTNDWDSIIPNLVSGNYDVIIAGGGVQYSGAVAELTAFAEAHDIPVVETIAGRANLLATHPLNAGPIGVTGSNSANKIAGRATGRLHYLCKPVEQAVLDALVPAGPM